MTVANLIETHSAQNVIRFKNFIITTELDTGEWLYNLYKIQDDNTVEHLDELGFYKTQGEALFAAMTFANKR